MKHALRFLTGFLLCLPVAAQAQVFSDLPEPLSPFVEQVITRTDDLYRSYVVDLSGTEDCEIFRDNAIAIALEEVRKVFDTHRSLIAQSADLNERTICHRYDLDILEKRMQDVRELMVLVSDECSELSTLKALASLHGMLRHAYESVLFGGLDPTHTDLSLRTSARFVPMSYDVRAGDPEATACPFHSDYAPPSLGRTWGTDDVFSYGCDATALAHIVRQEHISEEMKSEAEGQMAYMQKADELIADVGGKIVEFQATFESILRTIRGGSFSPPPAASFAAHDVIVGCREERVEDPDTGEHDPLRVVTWTMDTLPLGMVLHASRDHFSIEKNQRILVERFAALLTREGERRPLPFVPSDAGTLYRIVTQIRKTQSVSADAGAFGRSQALLLIASADAQERVFEAVSPLRSAVRSFGFLSSFPDPSRDEELPVLRAYVRDLALFLRRSCVYGFCGDKLDAVLARVLNRSCFPYGDSCFVRNETHLEECYENRRSTC